MYELRCINRCLSVIALVAVMSACFETTTQPDWDGGCFTVDGFTTMPPPAPHTELNDEFCIERDGDDWFFNPGAGMDNWQSISGDDQIPMELKQVNPNNIQWTLNVDVTDHDPSEPSHGRIHENGWAFGVRVNKYSDPANTDAHIHNAGGPGGSTHGGSAHANLN